jgi:RNA polymerase sigma factor (sigma-70 family)
VSLPPFQHLVDDLGPALRRHVAALAGPSEADDLVQETLIAALRAYDTLPDDANVRAWLWTIARHKVIDGFRASARRPRTTALPDDPAGAEVTPPVTDPDEALWDAVRGLPDGQRYAITLRFVDDLPYAQIGALSGCSAGAARQRVHDGLRSLRQKVSIDHA